MLDRYIALFETYFNKCPYMVNVYRVLAMAYLENNEDTRFIHKCHIALISNAQDELNYDNYYHELARAAMIAIERREA